MSIFQMNHDQSVELFNQFMIHLGPWDRKKWRGKSYPPDYSSFKELSAVMDKILTRMVKRRVFTEDNKPRDSSVLSDRLMFSLNVQPKMSLCQNMQRHQCRKAAYEGGFLTVTDIIYLETLQDINETHSG